MNLLVVGISVYVCTCGTMLDCSDVKNGFEQVPQSPVRVVAGDDFSVKCLANVHVYRASSLRWVTTGSNFTVTSRARLTVVRSQSVIYHICTRQ